MNGKPQIIDLDSFINNCIPDMIEDNVLFGVFCSREREGLVVDGISLKTALEQEVEDTWE